MRTHLAPFLLAAAGLITATTAAGSGIDVDITGVEGALKDNVAAFLSLKRYANAPDLDQDRVDRLALRARREATDALEPFGYYEAQATVTVTPQQQGGWKAVVAVLPGEPVILDGAEVAIRGPGENEPFLAEVLQNTTLAVGERLSHTDYDRLKGELQRVAASHGYLDASFPRHELRVDVAKRTAEALLTLDTGERYRFGRTAIQQSFLDEGLVQRYLRYDEGDWYDTQLLLRTQFALDDTDYFSVVEVLPDARDPDSLTVPIRINGEKNKRYRYRMGVGYATDTEWRLLLGWTNRQLNRRGHRLSAEGKLSKIETSLDLNYVIPWEDPALEKLSFRLLAGSVERGDITTTGSSFRPSLTQVRGRWQRVLFVNLDYTSDSVPGGGSAANDGVPQMQSVNAQRNLLLVPGISFALLPPGFVGVDAAGRGLYAELLGSASTLGSDSNFARLLLRDEHRLDLGGPWHLVLRGEAGTSAVGDFDELPAQYRFFAGGDRSVRGYGYNELSPTDAAGNKVGGRHLLVGSVEIERDLPRNFGVAAFFDVGNAFDRFGDPLEYSAGVGIRYRLPFLLLGLDVAQSLSESGRSPHIHLNFMPLL
jgi:translocation and assembly module TamA